MVQNIVSYTHTLIIMLALLLISCGGNSQNSSETILKKMKGDKYSGEYIGQMKWPNYDL